MNFRFKEMGEKLIKMYSKMIKESKLFNNLLEEDEFKRQLIQVDNNFSFILAGGHLMRY